tara:strand:+ start:740 stop:1093 length:354 start_codon:yes stop_codon:yes gene_type:complete
MDDSLENQKPKLDLKSKSFERVNHPTSQEDTAPLSVHEILAQNHAIEAEHEKPLVLNKKPTRRRKDYIIVLLLGNGLIVLTVAILPVNVVTLVYGFSGVVLYTIGLTWVMWAVMSNY